MLDPPFSAIGGPARAWKSLDYSPHNERPGSAGSTWLFPASLSHTQTAALLLKSCSALFGFLLPGVTFASTAALGDYGKETEGRRGSETRYWGHATTVNPTTVLARGDGSKQKTTQTIPAKEKKLG